jgi:hypothetical protein
MARGAGTERLEVVRSRLGCTDEEVIAVARGLGLRLRVSA